MENERRLLLAILLMILAVVAANVLFRPVPPRRPVTVASDTVSLPEEGPPPGEAAPEEVPPRAPPEPAVEEGEAGRPPELVAGVGAPEDTIVVRSEMYEYRFTRRGAAMLGARLLSYDSYAPGDTVGSRVELVRPGDRVFGYRVAVGTDTLDLRDRLFESGVGRTLDVTSVSSLSFRYPLGVSSDPELAFVVTYRFYPDRYVVEVRGELEGLPGRGYTVLTSLGEGLRTNEANPREDHTELAYVVHGRGGDYRSRRLGKVDPEERTTVEGGPFRWVAVKSKYFVVALVSEPEVSGFGGMLVSGVAPDNAARMEAALPVPADRPGFSFRAFVGPQDYGRLAAVGQELQNVSPYGYRWMRPIIRPLVGLIMAVLVWMHRTFSMGYGWVLMLFGIFMRIVLFPLYQKSMRAQMAQMQVQPLIREIQTKYKEEPQKLQQEMVKLYKEHNINPLAGCLPMLLPFPVLITLFFVFRNTIEVRGVPFLWIPDLSLKDPVYVIPILMGLSMFLLQWIGQRGMQPNPQMKMMGYAMPVIFTFLFMNFPSGLNLYYATSNFASLPQQLYLARERRKTVTRTGD
ncbi:MAG: membrane protein insertase YidC [Gemmatimonadota bacterium]